MRGFFVSAPCPAYKRRLVSFLKIEIPHNSAS
nr:MAG TPA_asm: hypothetical protein [Bacteriophage sp.]